MKAIVFYLLIQQKISNQSKALGNYLLCLRNFLNKMKKKIKWKKEDWLGVFMIFYSFNFFIIGILILVWYYLHWYSIKKNDMKTIENNFWVYWKNVCHITN